LAAVMAGKLGSPENIRGKTIVVVASGGNVDPIFLADAIQRQTAKQELKLLHSKQQKSKL
jgi:threonine dehydratase